MKLKYVLIIIGFFILGWVFAPLVSGGEITISDSLNESFVYPAETYRMLPGEFYRWAIQFNEKQVDEIIYSDQSKWIKGTGVRIDGYTVPIRKRQGHAYRPNRSGRTNITRETYPTRYLNPEYVPPTPLMILNPFCPPSRE